VPVLLVLAGPSGAGKGTLGRALLDAEPDLWWSVSWATRSARPGEVDGVDYHFVTRTEFERLRDAGGFLEWFEVYGDLKGTPAAPILDHRAVGHDVLIEVDVQGARAIRKRFPDAVLVFVAPPSREEQRARLLNRAQDSPEGIERRLAEAEAEEAVAVDLFDHVVVNDQLERAFAEVTAILTVRRAMDR